MGQFRRFKRRSRHIYTFENKRSYTVHPLCNGSIGAMQNHGVVAQETWAYVPPQDAIMRHQINSIS